MGPRLRGDDEKFSFINIKFFGFPWIVIPASKTALILLASCSVRGRFLEAILERTERELAGPGRPGTVDRLVAKVERREAPRPTSLGARGRLAARGGYVIPASGCYVIAPRRLPPLHPLARLARDWQTSDALRRENAKCWLFEICIAHRACPGRDAAFFMPLRRTGIPVCSSCK